ncbi:hypothetical protein [Tepidibacter hydrothermalis]|uniref:Lipoprotein n=1 Tax=Tepidibacter hydrothermalis TaxID=3036126 RepID=A0ABY8EDE4_9FIRM|nr:hypothetical protein [Tepidibacter hydrothermalis]WFD08773.1 hypothetical protein P4S50_10220 [Tepidibacter hydrothermalis]
MRKKYLIVIFIALFFLFNSCSKSSSNIKNYLNTGTTIDSEAKDIMPNLDDLPEYKDIEYKYTHKSMYIFQSDSVALIVNYDDKIYKSEKDKLEEKYTFLEEKDKGIIPEHEFLINSYTFKVVARNEKSNTHYPKSFGMIGTSEEKKSIAYLYFYDFDLDCIGREDEEHSMADFVNNYFDYNF